MYLHLISKFVIITLISVPAKANAILTDAPVDLIRSKDILPNDEYAGNDTINGTLDLKDAKLSTDSTIVTTLNNVGWTLSNLQQHSEELALLTLWPPSTIKAEQMISSTNTAGETSRPNIIQTFSPVTEKTLLRAKFDESSGDLQQASVSLSAMTAQKQVDKSPLQHPSTAQKQVDKLPLQHPSAAQKEVDKLPLQHPSTAQKQVDKLPLQHPSTAQKEVDKLPSQHPSTAQKEADKLPLQHPSTAQKEVDKLPLQHPSTAQKEVDKLPLQHPSTDSSSPIPLINSSISSNNRSLNRHLFNEPGSAGGDKAHPGNVSNSCNFCLNLNSSTLSSLLFDNILTRNKTFVVPPEQHKLPVNHTNTKTENDSLNLLLDEQIKHSGSSRLRDDSDASIGNTSVPIWTHGVIDHTTFVQILGYLRASMAVPCFLSLISVGLTVAVLRSLKLLGKEMVIAFNVSEGVKCFLFICNRLWKVHIRFSSLTWNSSYSKFFVYVLIWFPDVLGRIGILLSFLITLDRFFTLAFPIKHMNKRLITYPKLTVVIVVVSMLAGQSYPIILFAMHGKSILESNMTFTNDEAGSVMAQIEPNKFKTYLQIYLLTSVLFRYIPILLIIIFNCLTSISLYRHFKNHRSMFAATIQDPQRASQHSMRSQKHNTQLNMMLVVSSAVFALMVSLKPLNRSLRLAIPEYGEGCRNFYLYMIINDVFLLFDNTVPLMNIIVYSVLSPQFYSRLRLLLRCKYWQ